jgi:hypothetical protein
VGWQDDELVKDKPKWESDPIVSVAPSTSAPAPTAPMLDIRAGVPVPTLIAPSDNPFSAGRYPLGRIFTIGDEATIRQTDALSGAGERIFTLRVTRVDYDGDRVEFNNGESVRDLMGNAIRQGRVERARPAEFAAPPQIAPSELQVGKKWTAIFIVTQNGITSTAYFDLHIVKRETIVVPAGSFDTFKIEGSGWNRLHGSKLEVTVWLVPGLNFAIKSENIVIYRGRYIDAERNELIALRQWSVDTKCAPAAGGMNRTLAIKSNCT